MNKSEFRQFMHSKFALDIDTLSKDGQAEYALTEDAFDNFNRLSIELGISREQVLMVYFSKHRDGVISYLKGHKSQREPVQGRIKDMIVYLFLLWGMVEENENPPAPTQSPTQFTGTDSLTRPEARINYNDSDTLG